MSMLIEVRAEDTVQVTGWLVIDSLVSGEAHGGLRIADDVNEDRLREAGHTMTLKYGWAGLPVGGAKAGLLMPPGTSELDRSLMLRAFGRVITPYLRTGMYVPGEDMGSSVEDIHAVLATAGLKARPGSLMFATSGDYTGVGVCATALAAAASLDLPAKGLRVSIEGFGNVGASAALRFHNAGAIVVAVSTAAGAVYNENGLDVPELLSLRRRYGDDAVRRSKLGETIPSQSLPSVPVDIFCPCAIMHSITGDNVESVKARVICPGANVPATAEAEAALEKRHVLFLPDFVANCGGVLGSSMYRAGLGRDEISDRVERQLDEQTSLLILDAREQHRTLRDVATEIALKRFEEMKANYERKTPAQALSRLAVRIYRRGIVPRRLLAPLGRRYYDAWAQRHGLS